MCYNETHCKLKDMNMPSSTFSMRMDADMKRRLEEQASLSDRSAAWVAQRAIEEYLGRGDALREAVQEALDNDDGTRTSGEAVMRWLSRWSDGRDEPMPEPDIFLDRVKAAKSA
jgi:predicted transcriptional regulator